MTSGVGGSSRTRARRASKRGRRRYRERLRAQSRVPELVAASSFPPPHDDGPGGDAAAVSVARSATGSTGPDVTADVGTPSEGSAPTQLSPNGGRPRHLRLGRLPVDLRRNQRRMVVALGLLVVAGVLLTMRGVDMVWSSTAGRYVAPGLLPEDPDYVALVTPTPTLLVVSVDDEDELVGTTLVSLHSGDEGGSVIVMPVATEVPTVGEAGSESSGTGEDGESGSDGEADDLAGDEPTTLAEAYADLGVAGVRSGVERTFRVAVAEVIKVDDAGWSSLLDPVEPLSLVVPDPVGTSWPAGPVELEAEDVGEFLAVTDEDESELNRVARQELFWQAWMPAVEAIGDPAVPGEQEAGLGRFVRGLSAGALSVTSLPVELDGNSDGDGERFTVQPAVVTDIVAHDIPYPQEPWAGSRIRVKLLNGTTDADLALLAVAPLVRAEAEVAIMGNAGSFDETRTRFVYGDDDQRQDAIALRNAFGVGVLEQEPQTQSPQPVDDDERVDVTVILGADASQAIRRLETTG